MKYLAYFLLGLFVGLATLSVGSLLAKNEKEDNVVIKYTPSDTLSEWNLLRLAIVKTESDFNPITVGKSGDVGLYQITKIYVDEVNRILGEQVYSHADAFDFTKANEMFDIYQGYYNPNKELGKAICLHNPKGDCICYSAKVLRNMDEIKRYEEIRRKMVNL